MDHGCAGLGRLRKEVRTCEYSDVHVMWDMLSNPSTSGSGSGVRDDRRRPSTAGKGSAATRPARNAAAAAAWSRLASYCCAL
jgi:hypothetical protein